jgi:hypothetical protein
MAETRKGWSKTLEEAVNQLLSSISSKDIDHKRFLFKLYFHA